jgi:predicted xylose isomerase-like sugar epimerase
MAHALCQRLGIADVELRNQQPGPARRARAAPAAP